MKEYIVSEDSYEYEMRRYDELKELIRCKDCEYFTPMSIYGHGLCDIHCNGVGEKEVTSEDQYCSWAEEEKQDG